MNLQVKINSLENLYLPYKPNSFLILKNFLMRLMVILMIVNFCFCVMDCVNIWKVCTTQWTIFSKYCVKCYKLWVKDPFKVQVRAHMWLVWISDFGSGHDLVVCGFEPHVGLCADSSEPGACFGFYPSPTCALTLSVSQK